MFVLWSGLPSALLGQWNRDELHGSGPAGLLHQSLAHIMGQLSTLAGDFAVNIQAVNISGGVRLCVGRGKGLAVAFGRVAYPDVIELCIAGLAGHALGAIVLVCKCVGCLLTVLCRVCVVRIPGGNGPGISRWRSWGRCLHREHVSGTG